MVERIIDIFEKYDTDKNSKGHNYTPLYAKHLPESATRILEIGVDRGESIRSWLEIYPEAHVWGLDIFTNGIPFTHDRVTWITGSQTDGSILNHVRNYFAPFDFILEDGSHNHRDQLMTFFGLWGCTKLYVVEDIMQEEFWSQGLPLCDNIKSLNVNAKIYNYDKIKFFYAP